MRGAMSPHTQYAFMMWCSVKKQHRNHFTFTLRIYMGGGKVIDDLLNKNLV